MSLFYQQDDIGFPYNSQCLRTMVFVNNSLWTLNFERSIFISKLMNLKIILLYKPTPSLCKTQNKYKLTGASDNMNIISSISSLPNIQFLLTGTEVNLTRSVGGAEINSASFWVITVLI